MGAGSGSSLSLVHKKKSHKYLLISEIVGLIIKFRLQKLLIVKKNKVIYRLS